MKFFKRKQGIEHTPQQEQEPRPDVYVEHDRFARDATTSRFYLTHDQLMTFADAPLKEGDTTIFRPGEFLPSREAHFELRDRLKNITGLGNNNDAFSTLVRMYPQYLALTWPHDTALSEDEEWLSGVHRIENSVVAALGEYFGWEDPQINYLESRAHEQRGEIERRLNRSWQLGSFATRHSK